MPGVSVPLSEDGVRGLSATWRQCSGSMSREAIAGFGVPVPRGARGGPGVPIPLSEDEVLGPGSLTAAWRRGAGSPCHAERRRDSGSLSLEVEARGQESLSR